MEEKNNQSILPPQVGGRYGLDNSPHFTYLRLNEVASTNDFLKNYRPPHPTETILASTEHQTAGRGQRGNSWEAAAGKNLLFSLLIHPRKVTASEQFVLSQAIALSLKEALDNYTDDISIKWPNDIYWRDQKIAGILIENELSGKQIERCILGVGLNVNQTTFESDAPNPVSLRQILGHDVERHFLLASIVGHFAAHREQLQQGGSESIARAYHEALYRRDGFHAYKDKSGTFEARIDGVEPTGHLILTDRADKKRRYAFKEVEFVL